MSSKTHKFRKDLKPHLTAKQAREVVASRNVVINLAQAMDQAEALLPSKAQPPAPP
jgi:hypothetical protein